MNQPINLAQILEILQNFQNLAPKAEPTESPSNQPLNMAEKLNDRNYAIWARKMRLELDGRGWLKHITATPLKSDDPKLIKWRQADSTVITWILENIESDIVNQCIDYPTAWDLWKGIEATYGSGKDPLQEIDRRRPNPMKCPEDMTIFTQFLQAINEEFDVEKRDILKTDPLPSAEEAYAEITREATKKGIMKGDDGSSSGDVPLGLGSGFAATRAGLRSEKSLVSSSRINEDKSKLKCTYCGETKHTEDGCFKRIRYPDWWPDSRKRGKKLSGVAGAVVGNQETTSTIAVQASENFAGITMSNVEEGSSGVRRKGKEVTGRGEVTGRDIRMGKIIGRGSERNGLYYVEEVDHYGTYTLSHEIVDMQACSQGEKITNDSLELLHSLVLPPETVTTEEVSHSVRSSFENIEQSNNSELMSDSSPSEKTPEGFADATDMVGPSIEVMRPTSTQTALDAPSGFFTVHLASLKKGLRFPLHPLLIEFLNVVDLLPCQLVPNSHRYIAGYLVRCKDVGVKPTLDHFIFTFKLTKGHKDWASYASLSQRSSKLFASDKKGSTKDWKPFFVFISTGPESPFTGSGRPSFRRIPRPPPDATLLSITRQFCNKGVMNIKEVVTEETLAGLGFEFVRDELRHQPDLLRDIHGGHQPDQLKDIPEEGLDCGPFVELQDSGEEMDSDLLLSRFTAGRKRKRETKGQGKRSSSYHEESPSREPAVIVVEDQEDATQKPVTYEVATGGRSTRLCIPPLPQSLGDVQLETLITLPAEDQARILAGSEDDLDNMVLLRLSQATLGMIEVVGRKRGRQAAADEAMKVAEAKQKELQEEVARLTRELEEKENRCAALAVEKASQENRCVALEADKASLSLEVESVSARVVELEGEKSDLIQQLEVERSDWVRHEEGAVESFKSSPDFTVVAMERMEELTAAWLKTEPGAQWMVKEGTKSFNCRLFHAQQVFHDRLAQLPKGFSLPDLGFPPPCRSLAEFDPSPYLDGGSSSASEEEEEEEVEGGQNDQNPGASLAMSKAGGPSGSAV
ncbi:unnamed protein product [Cuscuta campestris]|uniref:Transposase (putative) gypsy type domain-containing protein n=1 Tax=Cuscuta campestris TaxID=132261 RepID=A0A484MNJ8_9ASTE|nr:unnamed protein product [Cuscuta campestris]